MRTFLSRLLLLGLVAVAVVAVVRLASGPGGALVALDRLDADDLAHASFRLGAPAVVTVDAVGSYEEAGTPGADTTMAAAGWVVRREDGAVVWRLRPPRPSRGTLVSAADTLRLGPGTYDAYFASYGDPLVRAEGPRDGSLGERVRAFLSLGGRSWVGEAGRWRLRLTALDAAGRRAQTPASPSDPADADAAPDSLRLWQARGVRNRAHPEVLISVAAPARVVVRATTEVVDGEVIDRPSIVRLGTRDTVWTASAQGSAWAGGSVKNRTVVAEVALAPGLYRVAVDADRSHGYDRWGANPPWRPWEWGMDLRRAAPGEPVSVLDLGAVDLPVIAAFECVGPRATRQAEFTVPDPTDVLAVAVGEIDAGVRYDWADLARRDGDGWADVWAMGDALTAAGGAPRNRREVQVLTLDPGTYRLRYRTDAAHDCVTGFDDGAPTDPLWGAVLYALDPDADAESFQVRDVSTGPSLTTEGLLAAIEEVGDGRDRRADLVLDEAADVWVVAAGELSPSRTYDAASIEREGRVVWEMTWENTVPGGPNPTHRRFEGAVSLPAGRYAVRYRTDEGTSGADVGPDGARLWGVRVYDAARVPDASRP